MYRIYVKNGVFKREIALNMYGFLIFMVVE